MIGKETRKRLTTLADALRRSENYWYVSTAEMQDLRDNSSTALRTLDVGSGGELSPRTFDPSSFSPSK